MVINNEKVKEIDRYISDINKILDSNDSDKAKDMQKKIIAVFGEEIMHLSKGLSNYSLQALNDGYFKPDYIGDLNLIKAKLENYKTDLYPKNINNDIPILKNEIKIYNDINISITNTIQNIQRLPENVLSNEDKESIEEKLNTIERLMNEKDHENAKSRVLNVVRWLADKSVDAAIAILPLIGSISSKLAGV